MLSNIGNDRRPVELFDDTGDISMSYLFPLNLLEIIAVTNSVSAAVPAPQHLMLSEMKWIFSQLER
jgi:hypothetical protein